MIHSDKKAKKPRGRRGFTLIELMVALVVLSLGLFSIVHLQIVTVRGHTYSRERAEAMEIANGIAQYLQTKGLEWADLRNGVDILPTVVYADVLGNTPLVDPPPPQGTDINFAALGAVERYVDMTTSADATPAAASAINVFGKNPVSNPGLDGARGAYRVHFVAHQIPLQNDPPGGRMWRVTIFVSWESKDHGMDVNWSSWWTDETAYWNRHMVSVTTIIRQARRW